MANFRIPGVPALLGGIPSSFRSAISFIGGDLISTGAIGGGPQWGVYKDGQPVVVFDTFVSIDYRQGWSISDFPLEPGAFESYDKVSLPFDARVKFAAGGSEDERSALLDSVQAIAKTLDLYTIVTPEAVYRSVNVQHYDYRRTSTNGAGLIQVELWFLEVRITTTQGVTTGGAAATDGTATSSAGAEPFTGGAQPLSFTKDPSGMSVFNNGLVQAQSPTQEQLAAAGIR